MDRPSVDETPLTLELPRRDTDATLAIPNREIVPVRVEDGGESALDIALLAMPATRMDVLRRTLCSVDYAHTIGLLRIPGLVTHAKAAVPCDAWGILRFLPAGPPLLLQRREHVRAPHIAPVLIAAPGRPPVRCATVNVSGGGLLVAGLSEAQAGDRVWFELRLSPGDPPIAGQCRVVHRTDDDEHGVEFIDVGSEDRQRLVTFVYRLSARHRLSDDR